MRSTAWCRVVRSSVYSTTTRIRRWQRALRIYEAKWGKGLNSGGMKVSARTIVNPDPRCEGFIKDILHPEHCIFLNMTGEHAFSAGVTPSPDMLFIDTDPHSRRQTIGWLNTWVRTALAHKGVAAFHDTAPARP